MKVIKPKPPKSDPLIIKALIDALTEARNESVTSIGIVMATEEERYTDYCITPDGDHEALQCLTEALKDEIKEEYE